MAVHKRKRMKQALVVPEIPQWYRDETITLETLMGLTLSTAMTGSVRYFAAIEPNLRCGGSPVRLDGVTLRSADFLTTFIRPCGFLFSCKPFEQIVPASSFCRVGCVRR